MTEITAEVLAELERTQFEKTGAVQFWDAKGHLIGEAENMPAEHMLELAILAPQLIAAARDAARYRTALQEIAGVSPSDSRWASEGVREYARRVLGESQP